MNENMARIYDWIRGWIYGCIYEWTFEYIDGALQVIWIEGWMLKGVQEWIYGVHINTVSIPVLDCWEPCPNHPPPLHSSGSFAAGRFSVIARSTIIKRLIAVYKYMGELVCRVQRAIEFIGKG